MPLIEVLSPVGKPETLAAAVRSGADAVYLGSTEFSARRNAGNFNRTELKNAVEYCHIHGVKVYLTLNIMLKDSEINDALTLASYANEIGVDALIIEDLGIAKLIRDNLPDLPIHASTQMTVHSVSALPLLKELGFSRVVLSREMSKREIAAFCKAAREYDISVEVFVHGALCMSVSGQCLLSAFIGRRSGNRGLCAGPCRLPFEVTGGTGYDLSLKDLSLINYVKELEEIGVASLKIEGRMKRPEYVAAATAAVRQAIDEGCVKAELENSLKNVFSRSGFTSGYFEEKIGRDMFGIRTKDDVISSAAALSNLHEYYRNERQSVGIDITVSLSENKEVTATATDGINSVSVIGDTVERAQKVALTEENVKSALSKLGSTPYFVKEITVNMQDGLFLPAKSLNEIRRQLCEILDNKRTKPPLRRNLFKECELKSRLHGKPLIFCQYYNAAQITENKNIDGIILPLFEDFKGLKENIFKIAELPRYIKDEEKVKSRLLKIKNEGVTHALCGNLASVQIAKECGLKIIGDRGLNTANSVSAKVLEDFGVDAVTFSAENTFSETEKIKTQLDTGIFAYGKIPLMLTLNCPLKNGRNCKECDKHGFLTDRVGEKFPVRCKNSYSEVLNCKPIYLADKQNDISKFDFLILSFTDEKTEDINRIINAYKSGDTPDFEFTRGLYYRNVL